MSKHLEIGEVERVDLACASLLVGQTGHLVHLHVDPVRDQAGLLQLSELSAEPAVQVWSCFSLIMDRVHEVNGRSKSPLEVKRSAMVH